MTYTKRLDGRNGPEDLRPMKAKVGIIPRADGSAMFQIGKTTAYAAVYGPRNLHPKFMQDPNTGILRCSYNMMPFSGHGERVRPGGGRRSKEISMVTRNALLPVLDLKNYPNTVVDVFIELPQTDAGTRCAGITAAAMALADAGLAMKDMVGAVAVGRVDNTIVADLNYEEEHYPEFAKQPVTSDEVADIAVAMLPRSGHVSLLQMDGTVSRKDLQKALALARRAIAKINEVQKQALRERYAGKSLKE